MKVPLFLSVEDVICIHTNTIECEGGLSGIRDYALLESAVLTPQQKFSGSYLHESIPAMAAAYLFHITQNHPFHDGNKRTGIMAAFVFIDINGFECLATEKQLEQVVLAVANGDMSKSDLIDWMQKYTK